MTNETQDVNAFLNSTGVPGAKFPDIGTVVRGTITATEIWDQTDMASGKQKMWDDGNPRKQLVITLQTDERDDEDDNGLRRLYAKKPGSMLEAIQGAVGASELRVGGKLAVKYDGDGEPPQRGWNAPKLYRARYEPPAVAVDDFDDEPNPPYQGGSQQRVMTNQEEPLQEAYDYDPDGNPDIDPEDLPF